ncbi:hypothetical protein Bca4012_030321 [Brassica carinata]|uniref:Uncharacterized protein n=1 Tax=Brassica carinata TaxID=52824 RepID=A0A8X7RKU5_BRACI|nr:hypothetical protein Bca52824_048372 [Brassica carinata]
MKGNQKGVHNERCRQSLRIRKPDPIAKKPEPIVHKSSYQQCVVPTIGEQIMLARIIDEEREYDRQGSPKEGEEKEAETSDEEKENSEDDEKVEEKVVESDAEGEDDQAEVEGKKDQEEEVEGKESETKETKEMAARRLVTRPMEEEPGKGVEVVAEEAVETEEKNSKKVAEEEKKRKRPCVYNNWSEYLIYSILNGFILDVVGEVMGLKPNPDYSAYCGEPTARTGCMFQCFDGLGALLHEKLVASGCIHLPTWILPKLVVAIYTVHGQGEDDNTGDDMPGVGAVKSTPSIDVTKEVPVDSARPSRGCTHRQEAPQWLSFAYRECPSSMPITAFPFVLNFLLSFIKLLRNSVPLGILFYVLRKFSLCFAWSLIALLSLI